MAPKNILKEVLLKVISILDKINQDYKTPPLKWEKDRLLFKDCRIGLIIGTE